MKFIFWQNIISIHQSSFLKALSVENDVILIVEKELETYRVNDGWDIPELDHVRLIKVPSCDEIDIILSNNKDAINVFSGIDAFPLLYSAFKKAVTRKYRVINMLEPYEWEGFKGFMHRVKYFALNLIYGNHIDGILAMGQLGVDCYIKAGFPKEKIFQWGYFTNSCNEHASQISHNHLKPKILFVGRLDENKNSRLLLETVKSLINQIDCLTIVGDGYLRGEIESIVSGMNGVNYLGPLPNNKVHALMQEFDIFVLPSRYDGWGAVVNEALQNGMRVIVSQNCGANVLVDGKTRGEIFYFMDGNKSLKSVLERWIQKGPLTNIERQEIINWADNHISGTAAATYMMNISNYIFNKTGDYPQAPWR